MTKGLMPLIAAAALLAVSHAYADEVSVTDTVKAVSISEHTVTLNNNKVYNLPVFTYLDNLKAGDQVTITYISGTPNATGLAKAN